MFRGRVKPKQEKKNPTDLVSLPNIKQAFIYQRLSTTEQMQRHHFGLEAQDALIELAHEDGYQDKQIYVEKRDLGISGTKDQAERPGLAYLIQSIEAGRVEAVYIIDISRLYRDQTLINAFSLAELFKTHDIILVTPAMRLNLADEMHMQMYRMVADQAARELKVMRQRLYGARTLKAKTGRYAGEPLPTGYVVDERKTMLDGRPNPAHHTYLIHEPHAHVIRFIFQQLALGQSLTQVVRICQEQSITLSPFPDELDTKANRKALQRSKRNLDGSWPLTFYMIRSIATNPAYIGWKIWEQQVISETVYPPIIEEDIFWHVQKQFKDPKPRSRKRDILPLSGLLFCPGHKRMSHNNRGERRAGEYTCPICQTSISQNIVDNPLGEAIISQITLPGLTDIVLSKLNTQYNQVEADIQTHRQEIKRLETETENLRENLIKLGAAGILENSDYLNFNQQIENRQQRIFELSQLITALEAKIPDIKAIDIEKVRYRLEGIGQHWEKLPPPLKNTLLRILIHKIEIERDGQIFTVQIHWRVGLTYTLRIWKPYRGHNSQPWTDEEKAILRQHWVTASQDELSQMLPGRSWVAIRKQGKATGLKRIVPPKQKTAPPFSPAEDDLVRHFYAGKINADEVTQTGRSLMSIYSRANKLGLGQRDYTPHWEWLDRGNTDPDDGHLATWMPENRPVHILDMSTIMDIMKVLA